MKIEIDKFGAGASPLKDAPGHKPAAKPVADAAAAGGMPAPQTGMTSRLKEIGSSLAQAGSFDAARVAEIRASIADGSFRVDAEVVAERMIASAHEAFVKRH